MIVHSSVAIMLKHLFMFAGRPTTSDATGRPPCSTDARFSEVNDRALPLLTDFTT